MKDENTFVTVMNDAVQEMHDLNLYTVKEFGGTYAECFPLAFDRKVMLDGKEYGMTVDIRIKKI